MGRYNAPSALRKRQILSSSDGFAATPGPWLELGRWIAAGGTPLWPQEERQVELVGATEGQRHLNLRDCAGTDGYWHGDGLGQPGVHREQIPTWGQILEYGFRTGAVFLGYWWWVIPPGLLIVLTAVTFMFLAQGLEPVVDPRLRGRRSWHF